MMSWMFVIAAVLLLANLAVAVRSAQRAPARADSDEQRLRQAIARQRERERSAEVPS